MISKQRGSVLPWRAFESSHSNIEMSVELPTCVIANRNANAKKNLKIAQI